MSTITAEVRKRIDVHSRGVETGISLRANTVTTVERGSGAEVGTGAEECGPEAMTEIAAEAKSTIDTENRSTGGGEGHGAGIEEPQDDREVKIGGEEGGIPGAQREKKVKVETKKNIEAKTVRVHTEKKILRVRKECTLKVVIIIAQIITGKKKLIEIKVQCQKRSKAVRTMK